MRVRHILPGFGIVPGDVARDSMSGVVGVAYNLADQQAACHQAAELIGLGKDHRSSARQSAHGARVTRIASWRYAQFGPIDLSYLAPVAARLARRPRADILHVYSNPYLLWPWLGRAHRRVIHYQTPIGPVPPAYVRALQRADAVICCSAFIRDQLLSQVSYSSERVHVVPNGVDLTRFGRADRASYRQELGIAPDELVILFAGQVNQAKGLLHLVRACLALAPEYPIRLLVAGSSGLWTNSGAPAGALSDYEQTVQREAAPLRTIFLGKVAYATMPSAYAAADLFVCPSEWDEPFGMVILEAMAAGLPVVASAVGGIPEIVQPGETGLLVPPADPAALAGALRRLIVNELERRAMGARALECVKQYGWDVIAQQVQTIYATL